MKILANRVSYLLLAGMLVMSGCGGKGDTGPKGDPGETGEPGAPGQNGRTGDAGQPGPAGKNGLNGADGEDGDDGDAGISTAPLTVTVTNSLTGAGVTGVQIALSPASVGALTTDTTGKASAADVPIGSYTLTLTATGYTTGTQAVSLAAGVPANVAVKLVPTAKVVANAGADVAGKAPGSTVTLTGASTVYDGSTGVTYSWKQAEGPTVVLANETTATPTVTLPSADAIKLALVKDLGQPIRLGVVGINPHAIELATAVTLELTVKTSSGEYKDTVNVGATAPFQVTTSLQNVPLGIPQLLQANTITSGSYNWVINAKPNGSGAALQDATSQWPYITPDLVGTYSFTETTTGGSITLTAGKYSGAITGLDPKGLPLADDCTGCHSTTGIAKNFAYVFPGWQASGHAEIFSQNVNDPANHWTMSGCASCHTVGYTPGETVANGGFYDQQKIANWTQPQGAPDVYAKMLTSTNAEVVKLARLANVQCENCHGPNGGPAHTSSAPAVSPLRVSLGAEVCGSCHGEPLRHGRYQQWQESGHGNYALAIARADAKVANDNATTGDNSVNSCGRCHSAEGFVVWQAQSAARGGDYNKLIQGASDNGNNGNATGKELRAMGMTAATVHSQTCTACHDPHTQGDTSGEPNTATLRISGDVAVSTGGFPLIGLGKGTLCATCHNSRNGLHNDAVTTYGSTGVAAPHDSTTADVILGQNAYFVTPGHRAGHSYITNSCTNCHMELSPPPEEFSYQLTGTNHAFEADITICKNCHGAFDGGSIQASTKASLTNLTKYIGAQAAKALNGKVFWARARRIPASSTDTTAVYSSSSATNFNVIVDLTAGTNSIVSAVLLENTTNIQVTFQTPINIQWTDGTAPVPVPQIILSLTAMRADDAGVPSGTAYPISLSGNLAKALWNYIILYREGSFGIHNPGFTNEVIGATLSKDLTL